jgi:hypothetical protein
MNRPAQWRAGPMEGAVLAKAAGRNSRDAETIESLVKSGEAIREGFKGHFFLDGELVEQSDKDA